MALFQHENKDLEKFANLLEKGLRDLFQERGEISFTKIEKERRKIVDYNNRMRADGMEKFNNEPAYVAAVNYYKNEIEMQKNMALGALIIYVEQQFLPQLMKLLKYPPVDDESENAMQDSCGTLCNIVAGRFKSEISNAGYIELEMSHFVNYRNNAFNGIAFPLSEYHHYAVVCFLENKKRLVLEMTIGTVPKRTT